MPPDPPLADEAVLLRLQSPADARAVATACTDLEIARWTMLPSSYPLAHARRFIAQARRSWRAGRGNAVFAITERTGGRLIGMIGLHPGRRGLAEVGCWVAPEARGRGHATRARRRRLCLGVRRSRLRLPRAAHARRQRRGGGRGPQGRLQP